MRCTPEYCIGVHCLKQENFQMEFWKESGLRRSVSLSLLCGGLKARTLAQTVADCQTELGGSDLRHRFTRESGWSD